MSQTSSTPGRAQQSNDSRSRQSLLEENQRLEKTREWALEEWDKDRKENSRIRMDMEDLRMCAEQAEHRAEEAERRAEKAELQLSRIQDSIPGFTNAWRALGQAIANVRGQVIDNSDQISIQQWQHRAKQPDHRVEQAEREIFKRRNVNSPKLMPKVCPEPAKEIGLGASTEGPASRTLETPSSQQQLSSRRIGPLNRSNADYHSRSSHEATSAVEAPVLKLDEPSNLRGNATPHGGEEHSSPARRKSGLTLVSPSAKPTLVARSSRLPDIPAASTTSAVADPPQTETESFRDLRPGAEPAGAQPKDGSREVNSTSAGATSNLTLDEEQAPDTVLTSVAAKERSKGIPAATSQTRGKYWPRGRI